MHNNHDHDQDQVNNGSHSHDPTIKKHSITEINRILNTDGKYSIDHGSHNHDNKLVSIRKDEYKGHKISITTTYDIEVDGKKIFPPLHVNNNGSVSAHIVPNYASSSAIELVKILIDSFPEDFRGSN
jgi:hypothetical protein